MDSTALVVFTLKTNQSLYIEDVPSYLCCTSLRVISDLYSTHLRICVGSVCNFIAEAFGLLTFWTAKTPNKWFRTAVMTDQLKFEKIEEKTTKKCYWTSALLSYLSTRTSSLCTTRAFKITQLYYRLRLRQRPLEAFPLQWKHCFLGNDCCCCFCWKDSCNYCFVYCVCFFLSNR